jgi:hypothetical protein
MMASLFSSPKSVKAPPVPEPELEPEVDEEVGDIEKRRARRRRGRRQAILTGELVPESTGKKTLLG